MNVWGVPKVKFEPLEVPAAALFSTALNDATQYLASVSCGFVVGGVVCQPESRPVKALVAKVKVALLSASGPAGAFWEHTL